MNKYWQALTDLMRQFYDEKLKPALTAFGGRLWKRIVPFGDMTAWVLLLSSVVPLYLIDPAMALTLGQWTAYALGLAGIAVVVCRVVLPQVNLSRLLRGANSGNVADSLVASSVILFLGMIFLGLVWWSKA